MLTIAIVKCIYKSGDKTDRGNYRPLSLLIAFSKILERLVESRLGEHVNVNSILTKSQYGFKKKKNTEMAIHSGAPFQFKLGGGSCPKH